MSLSDKKRLILLLLGITFFCWPVIFMPKEGWVFFTLSIVIVLLYGIAIVKINRKFPDFQKHRLKPLFDYTSLAIVAFLIAIVFLQPVGSPLNETLILASKMGVAAAVISFISYNGSKYIRSLIKKFNSKDKSLKEREEIP